jgi:glycosyltransferase involved in cell wall biosynthesis
MLKLVRITTVPISLEKLISGQMHFMHEQRFEVYMISSKYKLADELQKREKSTLITVNMTRTISPLKDFISLCKLILILWRLNPSIVHTHTPKAGLLGMMAAWITRVPIRLHTVAGLPLMEASGFKRKILEWVESLTYFCAVKVYPNSQKLRKIILENKFCSANKLKVIGNGSSNGIDTQYFNPINVSSDSSYLKSECKISSDDFVFIFIGRIVRDKGVEELVTSFNKLCVNNKNIKMLLVGPFEPELDPLSKECLDEIYQNSCIIHVGYKSDVRPYLAISNALVFPSYREGFPNVPMQAGCFELPSIVTDINGCNEIIENDVNGLIVPPKDASSLQAAMALLIQDKALYAKLKGNSRRMIVERYEQSYFWSLLLQEYHYQLNEKGIIL